MTQTGYSNAIVNAMLGWLKGVASWVLKLFNLSSGFSPLKFLADNWLKLLIFFLVVGMAMDLLVWLIRWRPHWVWFRKKRVLINDKNFFAREKYMDDSDDWDAPREQRPQNAQRPNRPRRNWEDSEYVVKSAQRRRREEEASRRSAHVKSMQIGRERPQEPTDVFSDERFNVNAKQKFSDKYEDAVFNVSDLPKPARRKYADAPARRRKDGRRDVASTRRSEPPRRNGNRSVQRSRTQESGRRRTGR